MNVAEVSSLFWWLAGALLFSPGSKCQHHCKYHGGVTACDKTPISSLELFGFFLFCWQPTCSCVELRHSFISLKSPLFSSSFLAYLRWICGGFVLLLHVLELKLALWRILVTHAASVRHAWVLSVITAAFLGRNDFISQPNVSYQVCGKKAQSFSPAQAALLSPFCTHNSEVLTHHPAQFPVIILPKLKS